VKFGSELVNVQAASSFTRIHPLEDIRKSGSPPDTEKFPKGSKDICCS
jgi:hypothetical protein